MSEITAQAAMAKMTQFPPFFFFLDFSSLQSVLCSMVNICMVLK